jgi:hypothetical protein
MNFNHRISLGPIVLLLSGFRPSGAAEGANQQAPASLALCNFDTAGLQRPLSVVFYLGPPRATRLSIEAKTELLGYTMALQQHFERPGSLSLNLPPALTAKQLNGRRDSIELSLGGPLLLPIAGDGELRDTAIIADTPIPELNRAVIKAVRALHVEGPPPLSHWLRERSGGQAIVEIGASPEVPVDGVPLLRARISILDAQSEIAPKNIPKPHVPAGRVGPLQVSFDLRYVVNAIGRIDSTSIEVLAVQSQGSSIESPFLSALLRSALNSLLRATFRPPKVGGCAVPQRVRHRFTFNLQS